MEYRMVFDVGSTAVKCAIADENNNLVSIESFIPKAISFADGFGRIRDSVTYWENILKLAENSIKRANINPKNIRYLTSTAIRPSVVFSDEDLNAVYIGASFDIIGMEYGDEIEEKFMELSEDTLYQRTGHFPNFYMVPARLEWLRNNPEMLDGKRIAHYFPVDSWILAKLGGEIHTNKSSAMESGFFDVEKEIWMEEWLSIFDLEDDFFPYHVLSGEIIGHVSEFVQERLGLDSEAEIVAGLPDTQAALLATNSITPGWIGIVLGTTTPVQAVADKYHVDPEIHTWSSGIFIKNLCKNYIVEASSGITGQLINWAARMFDSEQKQEFSDPTIEQYETLRVRYKKFDEIEEASSEENITSQAVYASLGPMPLATTHTDRMAGEFYFPSPSGVEESYLHQNQFIGAVFDNITFAISKNVEYAKKIAKLDEVSLSISGGISRFSLLCQRTSDLLNKPLHYLKRPESSIYGLLKLCDIASGKIRNMADLKKQSAEKNEFQTMEPRISMTKKLQLKYERWLQIVDFNL
ncbi:MAG: FGGY-family carbohydrate kinase [Asgard group archaeon]|nr:FGGY-family carbohydrate kinase [Asgard group archaeon]